MTSTETAATSSDARTTSRGRFGRGGRFLGSSTRGVVAAAAELRRNGKRAVRCVAPQPACHLACVEAFIRCAVERKRVLAVLWVRRPAEGDLLAGEAQLTLGRQRERPRVERVELREDRELVGPDAGDLVVGSL